MSVLGQPSTRKDKPACGLRAHGRDGLSERERVHTGQPSAQPAQAPRKQRRHILLWPPCFIART